MKIERLEEIRDAAQEMLAQLREDPLLRMVYWDVHFRKYVGNMTVYIEAKQTPFCELSTAEEVAVNELFQEKREKREKMREIFTESATLHRKQDQVHKETDQKRAQLPDQEPEYQDITLQEYFGEEIL